MLEPEAKRGGTEWGNVKQVRAALGASYGIRTGQREGCACAASRDEHVVCKDLGEACSQSSTSHVAAHSLSSLSTTTNQRHAPELYTRKLSEDCAAGCHVSSNGGGIAVCDVASLH
eukprot:500334-Prymnesium_polylepis.2